MVQPDPISLSLQEMNSHSLVKTYSNDSIALLNRGCSGCTQIVLASSDCGSLYMSCRSWP